MRDYTPKPPTVQQLDISKLNDKEFRELWADDKLRWSIAKQVHDIRISRGWTQEDLATKSGVAFPTINRIENPERADFYAGVKTLTKIAHAFDVALMIGFISWGEFLRWIDQLEKTETWNPPSGCSEFASLK